MGSCPGTGPNEASTSRKPGGPPAGAWGILAASPMAPRPPRFIRAVLPMLVVGVCLGAHNPNRTSPNPGAAGRVAVVAVDGADWRVIDELVAAGRLPAFARISKGGRSAP